MLLTLFNGQWVVPDSFLKPDFIVEANTILKLPDEIVEAYLSAIDTIDKDAHLRELAGSYHRQLFESWDEDHGPILHRLLADAETMGELAGMFVAVVFVSSLPHAAAYYRNRGMSAQVLIDTYSDIYNWMLHYHNLNGVWGLDRVHWLIQHARARVFRLGRLQFMLRRFSRKIKVFRHRSEGRVLTLSAEGIRFRGDGQGDGTNGIYDSETGWEAQFEMTEDVITGNTLLENGFARKESVILLSKDWELVLSEENDILDVHIAEGSPLHHEQCLESYRLAAEFFAKYEPNRPFRAFACLSWLLSPQLRDILPEGANILRFQSDYQLFPIASNDEQTFDRVFGTKPGDISQVPRETSLQRRIAAYYESGQRMASGAGYRLVSLQNL